MEEQSFKSDFWRIKMPIKIKLRGSFETVFEPNQKVIVGSFKVS